MEKRDYEIFFLFAVASTPEAKKIVNDYLTFLQEEKAEITYERKLMEAKLAYPIQKKTSGTYAGIEFKAEPTLIDKIATKFKRDDHIMRYLIKRLDKHALTFKKDKRAQQQNTLTSEKQ